MVIKTRQELIKAYIEFFKSKEHKHIPSSSLIPENDPTVLFTTAGMHPLVPFLSGEKHPLGKRLVDVQKCIRTDDIDDVGDEVHHTFFEMLGNWSLGDYWKKEAISWTFEFLTKVLGFDKDKLAVSCFIGDENARRDEESANVWRNLGIPEMRIAFLPKTDNWWGPAGKTGPCGPDTEIFYWTGKEETPEKFEPKNKTWVELGNNVLMQYKKVEVETILVDAVNCLIKKDGKDAKLIEILESLNKKIIVATNGNKEAVAKILENKFEIFSLNKSPEKSDPEFFKRLIEKYNLDKNRIFYFDHKQENVDSAKSLGISAKLYQSTEQIEKVLEENLYRYLPLEQKNVDFGGGVERMLAVLNGLSDNYKTAIFHPIIKEIEIVSGKKYDEENKKPMRIVADHVRAAVFILGDEKGIKPSNLGQGYVLRRLIRRAVRYGRILGIKNNFLAKIAKAVIPIYQDYQEISKNHRTILEELEKEEEKFNQTLEKGLKKFNELGVDKIITGKEAFLLFQSYGFPIEMTEELADEKGLKVDLESYNEEFRRHQDLSRTASVGQFKSGLADDSEQTKKLHTAAHLMNEALRVILKDKKIKQKGSNINPERLRFDFSFERKLTSEEIKKIEELVNEKISQGLDVEREEVPLEDAFDSGAHGEFGTKYPDVVSVYTVVDPKDKKGFFSKEICTGPHVRNTKEIGKFRIIKEESVATSIRRIKAVVE